MLTPVLSALTNESMIDPTTQGTLCAYGAVCIACLWRRYIVEGQTPLMHSRIMSAQLMGIVACGLWAGFANQARLQLSLT